MRARLRIAACLLGGALALQAGAAPAAEGQAAGRGAKAAPAKTDGKGQPKPLHTWYAQVLTRGAGGLNVTHFWSKGPKLRAETVVAGHRVITIVSGEWYYAYDGLQNEGVAIKRDPQVVALDRPDRRPFGDELEILLAQGAEKVKEEDVMGRHAGLYQVTDDLGRRQLWVTLDPQKLPLHLEIYDRQTAERQYIDYLNWQSELPIPDAFFQPEANVHFDRMTFEEYARQSSLKGPVGPVPVLYKKLLFKERQE